MALSDQETCAELAKALTAMCVRNAEIEDIHAGRAPLTKTGDFTDVVVIDADGNSIPWAEVSRISDAEMKLLMKGVVNRRYSFLMQGDDPEFQQLLDKQSRFTRKWDEPEIHPSLDLSKQT